MWGRTAALLCLLATTSLRAQQAHLDSGTVVRLHWRNETQKARLLEPLGPDSPVVRYCRYPSPVCGASTANPPLTGSARDLSRVDVRRGSRTGHGALVGAGVGAGGALFVLLGLSLSDRPAPSTGNQILSFAVITAVWTGLGALVGSASDNWTPVESGWRQDSGRQGH